MTCDDRNDQPTLALPLDTRAPAGSAGRGKWIVVLNAQADLSGRVLRFGGWRKFGWEAGADFVNQDLHDQLEDAIGTVPPEVCEPASSVTIYETNRDATGAVWIAWKKEGGGEVKKVRWFRDGVVIYDSDNPNG